MWLEKCYADGLIFILMILCKKYVSGYVLDNGLELQMELELFWSFEIMKCIIGATMDVWLDCYMDLFGLDWFWNVLLKD